MPKIKRHSVSSDGRTSCAAACRANWSSTISVALWLWRCIWHRGAEAAALPGWLLTSPIERFLRIAATQTVSEDSGMSDPKFEVPAELRNLAERTIEQAEKAFDMFFEAANKSMAPFTHPGAEISRKALSLTEQNMKSAFDSARRIAQASDLQEAMQIQSEFLRSQITGAGEQMKQIADGVMSTAKDVTEGKLRLADEADDKPLGCTFWMPRKRKHQASGVTAGRGNSQTITLSKMASRSRDHQHAILKSGSGNCCFALCWIGSVHSAGLCVDAHSLRSSRAYNRINSWACFKHLPQLSLIALGYEPAAACRSKRKAKCTRIKSKLSSLDSRGQNEDANLGHNVPRARERISR